MKIIKCMVLFLIALVAFPAAVMAMGEAERLKSSYCKQYEVKGEEKLIYIEGELLDYSCRPLVSCECHSYIHRHEEDKLKACLENCKKTPLHCRLSINSDLASGESTKDSTPIVFFIKSDEAEEFNRKLEKNKKYALCGHMKYPEKDKASLYAIPVIEVITSSLKLL